LLVSNHLSYLDIVAIGSVTPTVFVSKSEVAEWPVFGWFARKAGSIFVRRDKRTEAARSSEEIKETLMHDVLVVLFPEGTSSDGETVLPFKSALLEPAAASGGPLAVAHIAYTMVDGNPAQEVCYWGGMTLAPHLLNLLGKGRVTATIDLSDPQAGTSDRKELARQLHASVLTLRQRELAK
jgi:1-acyl-sn-glycerol-3-phosphate acyltransferase